MCKLLREYCTEGLGKCIKQQDWKAALARVLKDVEIEMSAVEQKGRTQEVSVDLAVSPEYEERSEGREELDKPKNLGHIIVEGMANHKIESLWKLGHEKLFLRIGEDIETKGGDEDEKTQKKQDAKAQATKLKETMAPQMQKLRTQFSSKAVSRTSDTHCRSRMNGDIALFLESSDDNGRRLRHSTNTRLPISRNDTRLFK